MEPPKDMGASVDRDKYHAEERHHLLGDDAFQNETSRQLFNAIDELKSCGASRDIENLPEIIIVGDQSVGKSSLLQSMTDIPFPVASKLCTRFPTRIVSRRHAKELTKVSIETQSYSLFSEPRGGTDAHLARQARYKEFEASYSTFTPQVFTSVIDEATRVMRINEGSPMKTEAASEPFCNFSEDILKIEIQGPKRSHFAILDLPGNFQSLTGALVEDDMKLVRRMVLQHMRSDQSIIVCVASGPTDLANQGVFDMASEQDPKGTRTIGVITKCDVTEEPIEIVEIVKNEMKPLHHGWFVVRNRSRAEVIAGVSAQEHNEKELEFFREKPWNSIPEERRGTVGLKKYLSNRLCARYQSVFPTIRKDIHIKRSETEAALSSMEMTRETLPKKRAYLSDMALAFHSLISRSLLGHYGSVAKDTMKLRMKIREANDSFASVMKQRGHAVSFLDPTSESLHHGSDDTTIALGSTHKADGSVDFSTPPVKENPGGPFSWPKTSSVGFSCQTTKNASFPFVERERPESHGYNLFQCINFMKPYSTFSFEELRLSDYTQDLKTSSTQDSNTSTDKSLNYLAASGGLLGTGSGGLFGSTPSSQASTVKRPNKRKDTTPPRPAFGSSVFSPSSSSEFDTSTPEGGSTPATSIFNTTTPPSQGTSNRASSQSNGVEAVSGLFAGLSTEDRKPSVFGDNSTASPFAAKSANTKDTAEIYSWIQHEIKASRGTELQGTLNPNVLPVLFHRQAQQWRGLAEAHFMNVKVSANLAVTQMLETVCNDSYTRQKIQASIEKGSRKQQESYSHKLTEHVNDILSKHLQTNNDAFEQKVKEARLSRFQSALKRYERSTAYQSSIRRQRMNDMLAKTPDKLMIDLWDTAALFAEIHMSNQQNLEDEIHDILRAYYEIARENFVEFVTVHIVERYLDDKEGPMFAFSPAYVGKMTDAEVEDMAAEDEDREKYRAELKATLERLVKAEEIADRCMKTQVR